jgi:hypothetical protein
VQKDRLVPCSIVSLFVSLNEFSKPKNANHCNRSKNEKPANTRGISDCEPMPMIAKKVFLDFQSSALPTELSCLSLMRDRWEILCALQRMASPFAQRDNCPALLIDVSAVTSTWLHYNDFLIASNSDITIEP